MICGVEWMPSMSNTNSHIYHVLLTVLYAVNLDIELLSEFTHMD